VQPAGAAENEGIDAGVLAGCEDSYGPSRFGLRACSALHSLDTRYGSRNSICSPVTSSRSMFCSAASTSWPGDQCARSTRTALKPRPTWSFPSAYVRTETTPITALPKHSTAAGLRGLPRGRSVGAASGARMSACSASKLHLGLRSTPVYPHKAEPGIKQRRSDAAQRGPGPAAGTYGRSLHLNERHVQEDLDHVEHKGDKIRRRLQRGNVRDRLVREGGEHPSNLLLPALLGMIQRLNVLRNSLQLGFCALCLPILHPTYALSEQQGT